MDCRTIWSEQEIFEVSCRPMYWYNTKNCERMPYFCNSARCFRPECLEHWAKRRLAICNDLIKRYSLTRFFTLTVDRSMSCREAWREISSWWNHLRVKVSRWLEKLDKPKMKFMAVLEAHRDGYPHIHGFWNVWIPVKILSSMWSECAPGYRVHLEAIEDSKSASDYMGMEMGKYIGKQQSINGARMAGHRKRTFWRSKGMKTKFELDKFNKVSEDSDWTLVKEYRHGQKKSGREDLEGACSATTEKGIEACSKDVEAQESEGEHGENQEATDSEGENQRRNSSRKGEVDYGYQETWYEEYSKCLKSGKECIPNNVISSNIGSYNLRRRWCE